MEKLGERVQRFRNRKGITQQSLAVAIGAHAQTIANIEQGRKSPRIETIRAIAEELGVTPGDILDGTE